MGGIAAVAGWHALRHGVAQYDWWLCGMLPVGHAVLDGGREGGLVVGRSAYLQCCGVCVLQLASLFRCSALTCCAGMQSCHLGFFNSPCLNAG